MTEQIDETLEKALSGDKLALGMLLTSQGNWLRSLLHERMKAGIVEFSADDVIQETYSDAIRGFAAAGDLNSINKFRNWLARVAMNRFVALLRHHTRQKRGGNHKRVDASERSSVALLALLADEEGTTASQEAATTEAIDHLFRCIEQLNESQQEAVLFHHIRQCSLQETASAMDKSKEAVRGLLDRARKQLRRCMGDSTLWFSRK